MAEGEVPFDDEIDISHEVWLFIEDWHFLILLGIRSRIGAVQSNQRPAIRWSSWKTQRIPGKLYHLLIDSMWVIDGGDPCSNGIFSADFWQITCWASAFVSHWHGWWLSTNNHSNPRWAAISSSFSITLPSNHWTCSGSGVSYRAYTLVRERWVGLYQQFRRWCV